MLMDCQIGLHTEEHANPMKIQWKSITWEHGLLILEKFQKDVRVTLKIKPISPNFSMK